MSITTGARVAVAQPSVAGHSTSVLSSAVIARLIALRAKRSSASTSTGRGRFP
jgi:hypothetical protein